MHDVVLDELLCRYAVKCLFIYPKDKINSQMSTQFGPARRYSNLYAVDIDTDVHSDFLNRFHIVVEVAGHHVTEYLIRSHALFGARSLRSR